jgi:hypothetical protein
LNKPIRAANTTNRKTYHEGLIMTALALVSIVAGMALTQSAAVAQTRRDAGQFYYQNGSQYYDGYPLRDWERMQDGW